MPWSAKAEYFNNQLVVTHQQEQEDCREQCKLAITKAIEAVTFIINSGALGTGTFNIILNGHCTPADKLTAEWSDHYLAFTINQVKS